MTRYDVIVAIEITDWRDVPCCTDEADAKRAEIRKAIAIEAAWAAKRMIEDKFDLVAKLETQIEGVTL